MKTPTAAILLFLSGMAALAHQLLWTRRMIDLLGGSAESSTRVFGCFFLGLAIGAALAGVFSAKIRIPLQAAALAEIGLALLTIPILFLPAWSDWIWPAIGPEALASGVGRSIKLIVAFVTIFPPALMMGLFFPLLIQSLSAVNSKRKESSSETIWLYATNTFGGAIGLVMVIVIGLDWLGVFGSMLVATILDAGIGIFLLIRSYGDKAGVEPTRLYSSAHAVDSAELDLECLPEKLSMRFLLGLCGKTSITGPLCLAFLSGAIVLATEVLAVQTLMLVATLSLYGPAAILFSLLACLSLSAIMVPRLLGEYPTNPLVISKIRWTLIFAGGLIVVAPIIFYTISQTSNWFVANDSVFTFILKLIMLTLLTLGPAWMACGMLFPMAMVWSGCDQPSRGTSTKLGSILAVNGVGGLIGAETSLRWFLPTFGLYGSFLLIGVCLCGAAWLTVLLSSRQEAANRHLMAVAAMGVVIGFGWKYVVDIPTTNLGKGLTLINSDIGYEGVVAVVQNPAGDRSIVMSNQYSLGGSSVRYDQERQSLLPLILHPSPRHVGCIGLATGITAGAALTIPEVEKVTAIELAPLVVKAAHRDFSQFNYNVTNSAKATTIIEDGRTYIAASEARFDVVTGDLFLPWAPGESRLYSLEHFRAVRRSLKPGGIFCQWLAMHQLTRPQAESVLETFQQVFPDTHLFMNHFRGRSAMLALVGWNEAEGKIVPWDALRQRCDKLARSGSVKDPILRHEDGITMLYLGRWQSSKIRTPPIITLDDPSLEISAASERLSGPPGQKYFAQVAWIKFCRELRKSAIEELQPFRDDRRTLLALSGGLQEYEHASLSDDPISWKIETQIRQMMPPTILQDDAADWARWPGSSTNWRSSR